jgi:hemolysin III
MSGCRGGGSGAPAPRLAEVRVPVVVAVQDGSTGKIASVVIYRATLALSGVAPLVRGSAPTGFAWLVAGSAFYTIGVLPHALDTRLAHAHGVWHPFVIGGRIGC